MINILIYWPHLISFCLLHLLKCIQDDDVDDTVVVPVTKKSSASDSVVSTSGDAEPATSTSTIATTVYESSRTASRQEFAGGATYITEVDTAIEK
jgi:ribosomal silencing factor RsfS